MESIECVQTNKGRSPASQENGLAKDVAIVWGPFPVRGLQGQRQFTKDREVSV
jgi:hypothetical protein